MRFKITWQTTPYGDGYKVSIPNYEGGEVVTLDEVQQIEAERDRLKAALDEIHLITRGWRMDMTVRDHELLRIGQIINAALKGEE